MTEQLLKPCPFCGTIPIIHEPLEYSVEQVGCGNKKCPIRFEMMDSEEWNTRASNKDRELLIELSLPGLSHAALLEITCHLPYEANVYYVPRDANIALHVRKHLQENP